MTAKVLALNGCFDYLHAGHMFMLGVAYGTFPEAKIVVGINSDLYLKTHKRDNHQSEDERKEALLTTGIVDRVEVFHEENPINFILKESPDIYLIGEEYRGKAPEEEVLLGLGTTIIYVPRIGMWATSDLMKHRG